MTYGIIKSHGGELKAFSGQGEGTRFIVELPIYHIMSHKIRKVIAMNSKNVLVIDDELLCGTDVAWC